jgi:hypothetical protein
MPAAKLNLTIEQGATYRHKFQLLQGDTDLPMDLTGIVALRMQIRTTLAAPTVVAEITLDNGRITIANPPDGWVELCITATETAEFDFDKAVYDLELVTANGDVTRLLQGQVTLSREATRA